MLTYSHTHALTYVHTHTLTRTHVHTHIAYNSRLYQHTEC